MNRLATETSPYLRQHADNPVDWFPWYEGALEQARLENIKVDREARPDLDRIYQTALQALT